MTVGLAHIDFSLAALPHDVSLSLDGEARGFGELCAR